MEESLTNVWDTESEGMVTKEARQRKSQPSVLTDPATQEICLQEVKRGCEATRMSLAREQR